MTWLGLDFETRSRADLRKVGLSRYARDPSTRALMLAWAIDDEPVEIVSFAEGEKAPCRLREALRDPTVIKRAWNAAFEKAILKHVFGILIPHEQWRCMMVLAYSLALPGSLDAAGAVVDLPADKRKLARGKTLIRRFCKPRKPTKNKPWEWCDHTTDPDEWAEFLDYCKQDVEAERALWRRLRRWDMPAHEWRLWFLDQEINERGIPIRLPVVHNAIKVAADVTASRLAEMKHLTELENPNSGSQLLGWLRERGYPFEDLKKGHVARARDAAEPGPVRRVLELRQEVSKTSVKKYAALAAATDGDGYLRGALQFAGAGRTSRWSGRRFQPQNLARPVAYLEKHQEQAVKDLEYLSSDLIEILYDKPMDLLSTCVRPVVQAPEGYMLVDADLNAIENRVLGWIAGCEKILDVFRQGRDPYVDFAVYMFGGSYEALWAEYKAGDKAKRTLAKPAVLGCGYMLGPGEERENEETAEIEATGLLGYARNMGVGMTSEQAAHAVAVWRDTFSEVVEYWYALDRAARRCIRTGDPQRVGHVIFDRSGPFMRMLLPSGRALHYCRPRIEPRKTPWGEMRPTITYEGLNDQNQWVRLSTHPGKLTENAGQAISRDLLAHGMRLAHARGLDIRLHVHDQIIALVSEDHGRAGAGDPERVHGGAAAMGARSAARGGRRCDAHLREGLRGNERDCDRAEVVCDHAERAGWLVRKVVMPAGEGPRIDGSSRKVDSCWSSSSAPAARSMPTSSANMSGWRRRALLFTSIDSVEIGCALFAQ